MTELASEASCAEKERILLEEDISLEGKRILDVGCGIGYWASFPARAAASAEYAGIDITRAVRGASAPPPRLSLHRGGHRRRAPGLGHFDVILVLDLIEHIVTEARLERAFSNGLALLTPGLCLSAGIARREGRPFFYLRWWSIERTRRPCGDCKLGQPRTFAHPQNHRVPIAAPVGKLRNAVQLGCVR